MGWLAHCVTVSKVLSRLEVDRFRFKGIAVHKSSHKRTRKKDYSKVTYGHWNSFNNMNLKLNSNSCQIIIKLKKKRAKSKLLNSSLTSHSLFIQRNTNLQQDEFHRLIWICDLDASDQKICWRRGRSVFGLEGDVSWCEEGSEARDQGEDSGEHVERLLVENILVKWGETHLTNVLMLYAEGQKCKGENIPYLKTRSLIVDFVDKFHDDLAAVALRNRVGMGHAMAAPARRHLCALRLQKFIRYVLHYQAGKCITF